MLKKLRRKMILINVSLVGTVLFLAMLVACGVAVNNTTQELYRSLHQEADKTIFDDPAPAHIGRQENPQNLPATVASITARLREDGVWETQQGNGVSIEPDSLIRALVRIQSAEADEDLLVGLRLAYVRRQTPDGLLVVLGDTTMVRNTMQSSLLAGVLVFLGSMIVCFFISLGLSNMAVKPIETAWQQQKRFVADASHAPKTPLTVILANNNIMSAHKSETVAQQEFWLRSTAEEARQMQQLINEMLTLAKTEDEQTATVLQPINISDLIEEELLYLEPIAYEKQISVEADIEKDLVWNSDPALLKKLVVILTDNAIKHGCPDSTVTVSLKQHKAPVLTVHNWGTAIPKEDLSHVFDRFYRSDKSRSTEGHGLGLAIAQAITGKLKGEIRVSSTEQDGTAFAVEFKI